MMPDGSIAYSYLKPAIGDKSSVSLESMYEQDVPIMSKYLAGVTDIDFNELEKALQELPPEQRERIEDYRQEAIDQLRNGTNGAPTRMALIHTHPDTYSGRPLQTEKDADQMCIRDRRYIRKPPIRKSLQLRNIRIMRTES